MSVYGSDASYSFLLNQGASSNVNLSDADLTAVGITGDLYELFEADISLAVDPSYAAALERGLGLADVSAVTSIDMSASVFDNFFYITVDSSDIDDLSTNDVKFSIKNDADASYSYPFMTLAGDVSMVFSSSVVQVGTINNVYVDQSLKKDLIRHVAKDITGGYAVADIFGNEQQLLDDVVQRDADVHAAILSTITDIVAEGEKTEHDYLNLTNEEHRRFYQVAHTLFDRNMADVGARQTAVYTDLSNNSAYGKETTFARLKFAVGDAIALRVQYKPASTNPPSMGTNPVTTRTYKILIKLK